MSDPKSMRQPFAEGAVPDEPIDPATLWLSGGVRVYAATIAGEDDLPVAALFFQFAKADGSGMYQSIALVEKPNELIELGTLIDSAAHAAVRASYVVNP